MSEDKTQTFMQQPCPPHQWAHAPTVGYFSCMKCRERIDYTDPRYSEMIATNAHATSNSKAEENERVDGRCSHCGSMGGTHGNSHIASCSLAKPEASGDLVEETAYLLQHYRRPGFGLSSMGRRTADLIEHQANELQSLRSALAMARTSLDNVVSCGCCDDELRETRATLSSINRGVE